MLPFQNRSYTELSHNARNPYLELPFAIGKFVDMIQLLFEATSEVIITMVYRTSSFYFSIIYSKEKGIYLRDRIDYYPNSTKFHSKRFLRAKFAKRTLEVLVQAPRKPINIT